MKGRGEGNKVKARGGEENGFKERRGGEKGLNGVEENRKEGWESVVGLGGETSSKRGREEDHLSNRCTSLNKPYSKGFDTHFMRKER